MSDAHWQLLDDVFHRAAGLSPEDRAVFLDRACGANDELRREVDSLFAYAKEDGRTFVMPGPIPASEPTRANALSPGDRLGTYEISALLGAGGMGEVYRAYESRLRRSVALKVLPAGVSRDPASRLFLEREAHASAALSHPHIAGIYGFEEWDGVTAIVMELVEGVTLTQRIAAGRVPAQEALAIAAQIAGALQYAHEKGIVHRDLKPGNIMVTADGHVKLLDFGLARRVRHETREAPTGSSAVKGSGLTAISGTIGYMSPEQAKGLVADCRTDLFSLGVILYHMLAGERPFVGETPVAVIDATLHAEPRNLEAGVASAKLKSIIWKLLQKDPARRYATAGDVRRDLEKAEDSLAMARPMRFAWIAGSIGLATAAIIAGWFWHRWSSERWARMTAIPEIARLADAGDYSRAAELTKQARAALPNDPTLDKLWANVTGEVSVASVPSSADVSIRLDHRGPDVWKSIGRTPIRKMRLPREPYIWRVSKPGFAPVIFLGEPEGVLPPGYHGGLSVDFELRPASEVPPDMVVVPGDMVRLTYPLGGRRAAHIPGFLIDRHEVTNEEYKRFVDAGGYRRREFWKQPFVKAGHEIPWDQAIAFFRDSTDRPGPATWEAGSYPKGRARHPVAGVSWYEAEAYAEFAGKSIPTAYHWTLASQLANESPSIVAGSNLAGRESWPVGKETALSGFGTTDMAGNVKEWCWNESLEGRRFILGGGFGDPDYMFYQTDAESPWERGANFGFRCVKLSSPPSLDALAKVEVKLRDYSKEKPVSDEVFRAYSNLYLYDKSELKPQVQHLPAAEDWSLEKVSVNAAYGNERVPAYLYLPKHASPPFQVVVFFPGAFAYLDDKIDLAGLEANLGFFLRDGRALLFPVYKGTYERRDGMVPGRYPPAFQRDHQIAFGKDLGRLLDYLETRKDIDAAKVGFYGNSLGGTEAAILPAIETRIRAAIVVSGGLQPAIHYLPEADPLNFVKHVTIPVLMLSGRYDTAMPFESAQVPMFQLFGTPSNDKKHVIYEEGHGAFPRPAAVLECLAWFDKYLGPVRH